MEYKSEDVVRQEAQAVLGLADTPTARAGVGQLTSWGKLGFDGAPDWEWGDGFVSSLAYGRLL